MKPAPFLYARPSTVDDACALLGEPGARVLAGGQSLVPMLSARAARPSLLVDLAGLDTLRTLRVDGGQLVIGAMVRQHDVETSALARTHCPLLTRAILHIAHEQVRTQGTVVGSVVHADPAAELPTVLVALDGAVVATSVRGTRRIAAEDFFVGPHRTALAPDELAVEVRLPIGHTRCTFLEESRRHNDLPIVGVAAAVEVADDGTVASMRLATGSVDGPRRLRATERALAGRRPDARWWDDLVTSVRADLDSGPAPTPAAAHARAITPVLVRRAVEQLVP